MRALNDMDDATNGKASVHRDNIPAMIENLDDLRKRGLITEAEFQEKRTKLMSEI
jgi:predicted Zn-dependent peptidase